MWSLRQNPLPSISSAPGGYCTNMKYNKILWEVWVEYYGISDEGRKSLLWKFQLKEVKCLWTLEQLLLLFSHSVVSYSLQTHRLQRARPPCPFTISWSLLKLIHIESMMPSNHLTPYLLLPLVFPRIRVFSNKSAIHIKWTKYWSFSVSINPSMKIQG